MKHSVDPIHRADLAEEQSAAAALRAAATQEELISVWWKSCEHFQGPARLRLQDEYAMRLGAFVPLGLAG